VVIVDLIKMSSEHIKCNLAIADSENAFPDLAGILLHQQHNRHTPLQWPIIIRCLNTGSLHIEPLHTYGTDALLLCLQAFALNQLLIGRTTMGSLNKELLNESEDKSTKKVVFIKELEIMWWNSWLSNEFVSLLPFRTWAKWQQNLQVRDIVMVTHKPKLGKASSRQDPSAANQACSPSPRTYSPSPWLCNA
jgi:hypothetical protein